MSKESLLVISKQTALYQKAVDHLQSIVIPFLFSEISVARVQNV